MTSEPTKIRALDTLRANHGNGMARAQRLISETDTVTLEKMAIVGHDK